MEKYKKLIIICLTVIVVVCLTGVGILIATDVIADKKMQETMDSLRESAEAIKNLQSGTKESSEEQTEEAVPSETPSAETHSEETAETVEDTESETSTEVETQPAEIRTTNPYRDSFLANEDMAGWLQIPGTKIDYPIMWTPRDENYYLYRDFDGNENKNGCLILDTDSSVDPLSTNLIIHGHNMKSGAMFGNLTDYENEDYYKEHKQITLYTEECKRNYEVIAVFRSQVFKKSDTAFKFYKFFQADTQEEFDDFYQNIKELSQHDTGVTAKFGDHFLTLSTCVYHVKNGRFVVVAKEVESEESYLPVQE